jgi:hypothetical protein
VDSAQDIVTRKGGYRAGDDGQVLSFEAGWGTLGHAAQGGLAVDHQAKAACRSRQ